MKVVLEERGVDTTNMRLKDMRDLLKTFPDFSGQKTILEDYIKRRGHIMHLLPDFPLQIKPHRASNGASQRSTLVQMLMGPSHNSGRLFQRGLTALPFNK